jgi:hypothetical protein
MQPLVFVSMHKEGKFQSLEVREQAPSLKILSLINNPRVKSNLR